MLRFLNLALARTAVLGAACLGLAAAAQAQGQVSWSIGMAGGGVAVSATNAPPVVLAAPVMVPAAVVLPPRPVVLAPAPVVVPAPVVLMPAEGRPPHRGHGWHKKHGHWGQAHSAYGPPVAAVPPVVIAPGTVPVWVR